MPPYRRFRKSVGDRNRISQGHHRYEHWYLDNQVYFITARCRDRFPAFASEQAKSVFWDRFDHYTNEFGFVPWVTSLVDNHYHTLGYLRVGENLGPMMQRLHGSVAKLVNDLLPHASCPFLAGSRPPRLLRRLHPQRKAMPTGVQIHAPPSRAAWHRRDWREYPHTHVAIDLERGFDGVLELRAFLEQVPYKRYRTHRNPKLVAKATSPHKRLHCHASSDWSLQRPVNSRPNSALFNSPALGAAKNRRRTRLTFLLGWPG